MHRVKRGRPAAWIVIAAALIALAIVGVWLFKRGSSPTAKSMPAKKVEGPSGFVRFRDGSTLEILGMCEAAPDSLNASPDGSSAAGVWWRVDGRAVELDPLDADFRHSPPATTDPAERVVE